MDLLLELDEEGAGADLVIDGGDLVLGHALRTQVLASLFCDARRTDPPEPGDPTADQDPRGYWADAPGERLGSQLWRADTLIIPRELTRIEQYARAALQWMVDQGIARAITVSASRLGLDRVALEVTLERATPARWQALWDAEAQSEAELGRYWVRIITR